MADPQAATLSQLRNIQAVTGTTIAELHAVLAASGLAKSGERHSLLTKQFERGCGDANAVALFCGKPVPALGGGPPPAADAAGDPLGALCTGAKVRLQALHEAVIRRVQCVGEFEQASKKADVSLRRKKQFGMVGPATQDLIEIGINVRDLAPDMRPKTLPAGGLCPYTLRITGPGDIDAELTDGLSAAYAAAG